MIWFLLIPLIGSWTILMVIIRLICFFCGADFSLSDSTLIWAILFLIAVFFPDIKKR